MQPQLVARSPGARDEPYSGASHLAAEICRRGAAVDFNRFDLSQINGAQVDHALGGGPQGNMIEEDLNLPRIHPAHREGSYGPRAAIATNGKAHTSLKQIGHPFGRSPLVGHNDPRGETAAQPEFFQTARAGADNDGGI